MEYHTCCLEGKLPSTESEKVPKAWPEDFSDDKLQLKILTEAFAKIFRYTFILCPFENLSLESNSWIVIFSWNILCLDCHKSIRCIVVQTNVNLCKRPLAYLMKHNISIVEQCVCFETCHFGASKHSEVNFMRIISILFQYHYQKSKYIHRK